MLTEDDLAAKVAQAFGEQAGRRTPATIDAAGIFRRGRRRRHRQLATRVASVSAAAGLVAGVLIGSIPSTPTPRPQGPAQAGHGPSASPQPRNGQLPGNTLLDARAVPALSAREADAGLPEFYIVASDPSRAALDVRNSATGKVVSTVTPPPSCDPKTIKLAAAGNGQNFVLSCLASAQSIVFYRLQVSSSGAASALTPLSIPVSGDFVNDMALSADGDQLAVGYQNYNGKPGVLAVVTLATGRVRTWTGGSPFDLTWGDGGREVAYSGSAGLYVLNVSGAGGSLRSARLALPRTVGSDDVQDAMLSPNGTIIASVTYEFHGNVRLNRDSVVGGIVEISGTTGKPLQTLLALHAQYSADGGGNEAGYGVTACQLGAIDPTGHHLLVSCDRFGRLDRGRFTPLPGPAPQDALYTSAW